MIDSERIVIADLTEDEQKWLDKLWSQYLARRDRNLLRASIYDGKKAVDTVGTIIAPQYRRLGIVLGWNAKAIDMLARRCNPERFYWADGDLESLGYTEFAESNNLIAELKAGLVSSLIHGPAFLINTMGAAGEPKSLLHVKDALSATGAWNPRRRQLDALLSFLSWDEQRPTGFVMYLDNLTVTATREGGGWSVQRQSHTFGVPAEALVYRPRTGRAFGSSRMTRPMIGLQNLGTRAVLRMEGHMDVYSVPQMVLMGASEDIFKNPDGSMKPSWQIALGRMLAVPDDDDAPAGRERADIKQFPASSPAPHMAQLSTLAKLFAREASLPDSALAIADMANPTSAEAYVAANDDLIAEAEGATDDWSLPARRAVARGLEIQNGSVVPALRTLDVKWRPPVHVSRAAAADAGAKQLAAGPDWLKETRVGLELLGLTESQIDESLAEKARMQGRATLRSLVDRAGVSAGGDAA